MLKSFLVVGAGGGLGAMLRYGVYRLMPVQQLHIATFVVNIIGSFILGLLLSYVMQNNQLSDNTKLFIGTGICGGLTTFSAFSVENMNFFITGKYLTAMLYIILSLIFGILAAFIGFKIIQN